MINQEEGKEEENLREVDKEKRKEDLREVYQEKKRENLREVDEENRKRRTGATAGRICNNKESCQKNIRKLSFSNMGVGGQTKPEIQLS